MTCLGASTEEEMSKLLETSVRNEIIRDLVTQMYAIQTKPNNSLFIRDHGRRGWLNVYTMFVPPMLVNGHCLTRMVKLLASRVEQHRLNLLAGVLHSLPWMTTYLTNGTGNSWTRKCKRIKLR